MMTLVPNNGFSLFELMPHLHVPCTVYVDMSMYQFSSAAATWWCFCEKFYDGDTDARLSKRLCGSETAVIEGDSHWVRVEFHTDGSVSERGWNLTWNGQHISPRLFQ